MFMEVKENIIHNLHDSLPAISSLRDTVINRTIIKYSSYFSFKFTISFLKTADHACIVFVLLEFSPSRKFGCISKKGLAYFFLKPLKWAKNSKFKIYISRYLLSFSIHSKQNFQIQKLKIQNVNFEYISGIKILYSVFNSGIFLCVLPRRLCCALRCAVESENKKQAYKHYFLFFESTLWIIWYIEYQAFSSVILIGSPHPPNLEPGGNTIACGWGRLQRKPGTLWGLGTEEEQGYRPPEPVFVNVYGAQESIPRNRFRQLM